MIINFIVIDWSKNVYRNKQIILIYYYNFYYQLLKVRVC